MPRSKKRLLLIPTVFLLSLIFLAIVAFFGLEYHATKTVKHEMQRHIQEFSDHVKIEYDSLAINWLAFTVNLNKVKVSKPPLPGIITIDKVRVRDLTSIGIKWIPTLVVFDNLALTNKETILGVQRLSTTFSLTDIPTPEELEKDWTVFLDYLRTGEANLQKLAFSEKETQFQVSLEEADFSLDKRAQRKSSLKTRHLKFQKKDLQFQCDTFHLAFSLDQNNVLTHLTKQVKDFSFQFPKGLADQHPFLQEITSLGYDRLAFGIDLNYDYQPEGKNVRIAWDTSAANMGKLQLNLGLTDYVSPPVPLRGSLPRLMAFLKQLSTPPQNASLQELTIKYQDFGLVPRLIKAEAQSRNQSPEEFSQKLVRSINATLLILPVPASLKEQIQSVNRFLLKPEEIQLAVTCRKPLRLKNLEKGSLQGLFEILDNAEVKIISK